MSFSASQFLHARSLQPAARSAPAYRQLPRRFVHAEAPADETRLQKMTRQNAMRWNGRPVAVPEPVLNGVGGRTAPVQKSNQISLAVQECFTDYIGYQDQLFREFARLQGLFRGEVRELQGTLQRVRARNFALKQHLVRAGELRLREQAAGVARQRAQLQAQADALQAQLGRLRALALQQIEK